MFAVGNLLVAIADILDIIFKSLEIVIVVRVILSWANADSYNQFVRVIYRVTEPFLAPWRKLLPPWKMSGLDLSPALAILSLYFLRAFLVPTFYELSTRIH